MKRLFFILFSFVLVSSCLDDGSGMSQSYTLTANFQYSNMSFFPDSTFFNTQTPQGFGYDVINFYHLLDPDKVRVDGGFILSCLEMPLSGNTEGLNNTYRCYQKDIKKKYSNTYTVFYQNEETLMPEHDINFPFINNGSCSMGGFFVTNTVEVADYIKENFEKGDRMSVKITGYLNGKKTGETEFLLADFSAEKDSIVSTWTPVELDMLGSIEYVDFKITSTKEGTPAYFCMDELTYSVDLTY